VQESGLSMRHGGEISLHDNAGKGFLATKEAGKRRVTRVEEDMPRWNRNQSRMASAVGRSRDKALHLRQPRTPSGTRGQKRDTTACDRKANPKTSDWDRRAKNQQMHAYFGIRMPAHHQKEKQEQKARTIKTPEIQVSAALPIAPGRYFSCKKRKGKQKKLEDECQEGKVRKFGAEPLKQNNP